MTDKQKMIFADQVLDRLIELKDDRERMAYLTRMLWRAKYVWGGESINGADCSGSISFSGYLLGYNVRVTADAYDKLFSDPLDGAIPEAGDVCVWYHPGETRAKHIAMFSDHLMIMDADRHFIDTPVSLEIMDRPGQAFSFRRLNLARLKRASDLGTCSHDIDASIKPLFGMFKVES